MKKTIWMMALWLSLVVACDDEPSTGTNNANNTNNLNNANNINNVNNANNQIVVEPDEPGPADITVFVDATEPGHAISPLIYGMNMGGAEALPKTGIPFWRIGGNRWSAYNWENNASNAGNDWNWQNDAYLGGGTTPGEAAAARMRLALADGDAHVMVTLAMAGRVAADFDGPVAGDGSEAGTDRFVDACPQKPGAFAFPPDPDDDCVYQDEFAAHLLDEFSAAAGRIVFSLDNEPDLWSSTHSEIHPDPATYAEVGQKSVALAAAVRQVAPDAGIYGYAGFGYYGFVSLAGAPDAGEHGDFIDYFLQTFAQAETEHGARLLDVLDVHWYPEARGGGERITSDADGAAICAARMQAPRSLWDPGYVEDSWISNDVLGGPIMLLPWLFGRIGANYPGTGLSVSEYYYGGGAHICGAIAQADVLGIFGREGVQAANLWHLGDTDDAFIRAAFDMFLNFDGGGSRFGPRGLVVEVSDTETFSAYAAKREGIDYETTLVLINKRDVPVTVSIRARDYQQFAFGRVFQLSPDSPAPAEVDTFQLSGTNAGILTLPATTVTTLVLMPPL